MTGFAFMRRGHRPILVKAYNGGLLRFHWNEQQQPVRESTPGSGEGLPSDAVHDLTMDAFHRLWALTRSGLLVIEPGTSPEQRPIVHRLSEEAGIYCNQWIGTRIASDDKGAVWMSLQNSLYRFDPANVQFDNTPPSVAIEDIQLNLHPTQWGAWSPIRCATAISPATTTGGIAVFSQQPEPVVQGPLFSWGIGH